VSAQPLSSRLVLWLAVFTLLLKSAVPMFAAGAAQMRGVSVAEVCPIYGVAVPGAGDEHAHHGHHHADASHDGAAHDEHQHHHNAAAHGDHCALSAIGVLTLPDLAASLPVLAPEAGSPIRPAAFAPLRDASAAWVARMKQGPPAIA
jgi:ABC-type Zn2+ transport system substrate-binding protein/surface adhesin